jgi:pimeloyl-ACP methyl ester carboxylesterase
MSETVVVDNRGVRLTCEHWGGDGSAGVVVMLHGSGGNRMHWNTLGPALARELDGVAVVSLDQRGHGDSDKPRFGYDPDLFALDALEVWRTFGGGPLTVVGHSRGGWLAAYMATHWPEHVERLVLVDPARLEFADVEAADRFYGKVRSLQGPFASMESAIRYAQQLDPVAKWTDERVAAYSAGFEVLPDGAVIGKLPRWVIDRTEEVRMGADRVGPWLDRVTARTLLFIASTSDDERIEQKRDYERGIPQTKTVYLEGSHYLAHDFPDEIQSEVLALFN